MTDLVYGKLKIKVYKNTYREQMNQFDLYTDDWQEYILDDTLWDSPTKPKAYVALYGDKVVGFIATAGFFCLAIEVLPEFRNRGIATAMVKYTKAETPLDNMDHEFWKRFTFNQKYIY